jgi:hypothetical protein
LFDFFTFNVFFKVSGAVVQSQYTHKKMFLLIFSIFFADITMVLYGIHYFGDSGLATTFLLCFELWIICEETILTLVHYSLFIIDFYYEKDVQTHYSDVIYYFNFFLTFLGEFSSILYYFHIWYVHNFTFSFVINFLTNSRLISLYLCC